MQMTLTDLRAQSLDWLDNPSGDLFAPAGNYARLDRLLNESYRSLVLEVSRSSKVWNIHSTKVEIDVVPTAAEYAVNGTDSAGVNNVRKIVDVVRTDLTDRIAYTITPYSERYRPSGIAYNKVPTLRLGRAHAVYVYRTALATWIVGFSLEEPETQTIEVTYEPTIDALDKPLRAATQVPPDWQSLIAIGAAILGLKQAPQSPTGDKWKHLQTHYDRELLKMREDLGTIVSSTACPTF